MALAALIVSIVVGAGLLRLGYQQVQLGRRQTALEEQRAAWELESQRRRSEPDVRLHPAGIGQTGPSMFQYRVDAENASEVYARSVHVTAFFNKAPVGATPPEDIAPGKRHPYMLDIAFGGSMDDVRRGVSFVARDRDGREWKWDA